VVSPVTVESGRPRPSNPVFGLSFPAISEVHALPPGLLGFFAMLSLFEFGGHFLVDLAQEAMERRSGFRQRKRMPVCAPSPPPVERDKLDAENPLPYRPPHLLARPFGRRDAS
jgi:hypothetical protein